MSMKISEIREKTDEDLNKELKSLKRNLLNLRFQKKSGSISDFSQFSKVRKLIARISTVISERKLSKLV